MAKGKRRIMALLLAVLTAPVAGPAGGETAAALLASSRPLSIQFFVDRKLPDDLRPSLWAAYAKLRDERCREVLTDFSDVTGTRLDRRLATLHQSLPSYLGWVLFYDGRDTAPCLSPRVVAWTNPGSRAVRICWRQFADAQRENTGYTAAIIIHETLHTLGLGERPPSAHDITARVIARCGQ